MNTLLISTSVFKVFNKNEIDSRERPCIDSERSEECIDFTMKLCVFFFVSVTTFWSSKSVKVDPVSDRKVNVVCTLGGQNAGKNQKKSYGKTGIFTQNKFSTKSIFLYGFNSKTNHCKFLKFSPNIYVSVIYIQLNFQKILIFFECR
ncbi:Uncharacterized protein FWK35_00034169 [Aphis craccivora]|uniref:Uncharacterized protein n=1 Tax=Aphis craccivora TaxID=307492 RepID=A0A6G0VIQ7_APHCR|nr:Uncharacterized protein FWK35_00034169 [Aphis craccivora]